MDAHEKRGRPDIIHTTLLFILGSPLNRRGYVDTYIHTINDYVIWINPKTRIPKNYNRFKGLMAKLFLEKEIIANSDTLIKMSKKTITALIKELLCDKIFVLTEKGKQVTTLDLARDIKKSTTPCIIIGGFPHGDFSSNIYSLGATFVSIYSGSLHTWVVTAKIISSIENLLSL